MGLMDEIKQERQQAASSQALSEFFIVQDGGKKTVRFLLDGDDGVRIIVHTQWDDTQKKYVLKAICAKHFNMPCTYCEREDGDPECPHYPAKYYGWPVFNITDSRQQWLLFKRAQTTPIDQITENWEHKGTLLDRSYTMTAKGQKTQVRYHVMADDKEPFSMKAHGIRLPVKDGKIDIDAVHKLITVAASKIFPNESLNKLLEEKASKNGHSEPHSHATPVAEASKPNRSAAEEVLDDLELDLESSL